MSKEIFVLDLKGSAYERGYIHGELLAQKIRGLCEIEINELRKANNLDYAQLLALIDEYIPLCLEYSPDLVDELKGISEGADVPFREVIMLNLFLDLSDLSVSDWVMGVEGGCSSFGLRRNLTEDGAVCIGQTVDLNQYFENYTVVLRIPIGSDAKALIFSFAGILGCLGVNSYGMGILINKLHTSDLAPGVPYPMIIRHFLEQNTLSQGIGSIVSAKRASSMNYLVADENEVIDIETTIEDIDFIFTTNHISHTNHYLSQKLKPFDAMPSLIRLKSARSNTYVRYSRLTQLLNEAVERGKLEYNHLLDITRDHADYPFGICHHGHLINDAGTGKTVAGVIIRTGEGEMCITNGNPCESEYEIFTTKL